MRAALTHMISLGRLAAVAGVIVAGVFLLGGCGGSLRIASFGYGTSYHPPRVVHRPHFHHHHHHHGHHHHHVGHGHHGHGHPGHHGHGHHAGHWH